MILKVKAKTKTTARLGGTGTPSAAVVRDGTDGGMVVAFGAEGDGAIAAEDVVAGGAEGAIGAAAASTDLADGAGGAAGGGWRWWW